MKNNEAKRALGSDNVKTVLDAPAENPIPSLCTVQFPARFLSHIEKVSSGCWIWTGAKSGVPGYPQYAYGRYAVTTRPLYFKIAHRFSYEFANGPIPQGLEIDHKCQVKLCVNPDHLEVVTHQENCRRRPRSGRIPKFPKLPLATIRRDLQEACAAGREHLNEPICLVSQTGWVVIVEREYNMPRGGPMSAWKYLYYLRSPEGIKLGGYDRADSFVSWAVQKAGVR